MMLIDQRRRSLGRFEVGRVLPHPHHHMVGPFIFFDHLAPSSCRKACRETPMCDRTRT